jgi:DNA-binding PadR family transcriptional regulator
MSYRPRSPERNKTKHWALAVLCLLREREMHPYEMRRLLRERHKEERLLLKAGSLYHAIGWLEQESLIEPVQTSRQGKRPERTVYRIKPAGEERLLSWLRELLSTPIKEAASFAVALDHAIHLPPEGVAEQLEKRAGLLQPRIQELEYVLQLLGPKIGRVNLLEIEFECAMCKSELTWIRQVAMDLRSGGLTWDLAQVLRYLRSAATPSAAEPAGNSAASSNGD